MMTDPSSRLTPEMVSQMLERAIKQCRPLVEVRNRELMDIARGMPPLNLEQRLALYRSTAETLDRQSGNRPVSGTHETRGRTSSRRRANVHEFLSLDDDASTGHQSTDYDGDNDDANGE